MRLTATPESFRLAEVFTISRGSRTEARVVTVTVSDGQVAGRGGRLLSTNISLSASPQAIEQGG